MGNKTLVWVCGSNFREVCEPGCAGLEEIRGINEDHARALWSRGHVLIVPEADSVYLAKTYIDWTTCRTLPVLWDISFAVYNWP